MECLLEVWLTTIELHMCSEQITCERAWVATQLTKISALITDKDVGTEMQMYFYPGFSPRSLIPSPEI